ncbi:unnamed protein product [Tilletia controversa]|nr:unnamed protein product [Tilletia controversa]CAD6970999.1 unnamed protein product [Tilletia controversa]
MSRPHEPPTFYVPGEAVSTGATPHATPARGIVSSTTAPALTRVQSSRVLHDADVGALDAGYGFYSSARSGLDDARATPFQTRPRSASQAPETARGRWARGRISAGPLLRRAVTNTADSPDQRVRDVATGTRRGWFSRGASQAHADGNAEINGAPSHTAAATAGTQAHHHVLLEAIQRDFEADRVEEATEARELAEVRKGGTGQHAFNKAHKASRESAVSEKVEKGDVEAQSTTGLGTGTDDTAVGSEAEGAEKGLPASEKEQDPNLVGWDSPSDPANPRNWSNKKKWLVTTIVSSYTLLSPLSSSMVAPALPILDQEFGVTNEIQSALMLSTFVLAYAIGPLLFGGLSEMYGRLPVLQIANILLIIFTVAGGLAQTSVQMTAFRFFAGLGGSAPLTIGGGVIADIYAVEERGKGMSIYSLAPLLGPCIGPVVAGWIIQAGISWRWIFWVVLIASGVVAGFGFLTLPETYAPIILAKKRRQLVKEAGNTQLRTVFDVQRKESFPTRLRRNFFRPFIFMTTQPAVQALSLYMMVVYGTLYLLLTNVDSTFSRTYNQGPGIASLHYIALGLGFTAGGQIGGRLVDKVYRILKRKNNGVGRPEFKLPFMVVSSPLVPAGLLLYGWPIQYAVHWIVPDIGLFLFGVGMMGSFLSTQNFLVDTYQLYAASAVGAAVFLRSIAGFALPLAAPALYGTLGSGWGNSLLALIAALIGIPAPVALYLYGPILRKKSKYASEAS